MYEAIKGRYVDKITGLTIANDVLHHPETEDLNERLLRDYQQYTSDILRLSHNLGKEKRHAVMMVSKTEYTVMYIRNNKLDFFIFDIEKDTVTRYLTQLDINRILSRSDRLYSQCQNVIERGNTRYLLTPDIDEKIRQIEAYIDNPTRAGPPKSVTIDHDFDR